MSDATLSDLDLATLLCTRLCHDLAGPVGAVSAGAELLADETDPSFITETAHLLRHSADAASARLKFLRAAFGVSGRISGAGTAKAMALAYVDAVGGDSLPLAWSEDAPALGEVPDAAQLLLNMILVAVEAAHGSGRLTVEVGQTPAALSLGVATEGRRAALTDEARAALRGDGSGVSARTVQAYWTHRLAAPHGGLTVEEGDGRLALTATHPVRTA